MDSTTAQTGALVQSVAPFSTPTPVSATNAQSGNVVAAAGAADTSTRNTQIGVGSVAGGSGSLIVDNTHASSVVDSSAASGRSGVSVALAPNAPNAPDTTAASAGNAAAPGATTARSGDTSAAGLTASNDVSSTALQVVTVGGASQAPVSLSSRSVISVQDTGASGATSGAAWAVAAGASGAPSNVTAPGATGAGPASAAVSSLGLQAQNSLSNAASTSLILAGGPGSTAAITIAPGPEVASATSGGLAAAASGAACASATCLAPGSSFGGTTQPTTGLTRVGEAVTQAASGAANAQGLTAQNTVNTTSIVAVRVAGQNFAPIRIVVDSLTSIFNWGVGSASSGDATAVANGTSNASLAQSASSGSAQATGAQVQNTVDLRSSASVRVNGDNYNPIDIVLNLASSLVNWGVGLASSGDAQATGNGGLTSTGGASNGGSASSGGATATGLQVLNLVTMWADASVDVEGNNYAPITVEIHFKTNIDNRGYAGASSGNVAAGQSGQSGQSSQAPLAAQAASQAPTSLTVTSGGNGPMSSAVGGSAVSISNSVNASVVSNQIASANGGKPIASAAITSLLRNLPSGDWSPFLQPGLADPLAPPLVNGVTSTSGNTAAFGLQSSIAQTNSQIAVCADAGVACLALNSASISTTVRDLPNNPATVDAAGNRGPGGTYSDSGFAGVNATPTPVPVPVLAPPTTGQAVDNQTPGNDRSGSGGGVGGSRRSFTSTELSSLTVAGVVPARGRMVLVDLWDRWPGRRLPPMPDQRTPRAVTSSVVGASLDAWPGADELPLPPTSVVGPEAPQAASGLSRRSGGAASTDGPIDFDSTDDSPLLAIQDVDPLAGWPDPQTMPLPMQALAAPTLVGEQASVSAGLSSEPETGLTPLVGGGLAILSAVLAGLIGSTRGRALMAGLYARLLALPHALRRRFGGLVLAGSTARGLALLRLTLGILRLW